MPKDIPDISFGEQSDYKRLYYSNPDAALKVPITLQAGYGKLEAGTAISKNDSAAGNLGKYIPYDPTATITGAEVAPGRAYIVAENASSEIVYVTMDDSYKFAVADDLIICDSDGEGALDNMGAIVTIDRTTYTHMAIITATVATGDTFTIAKFAYVMVEGAVTCDGILEKTVDTGTGSKADGAIATMIIGNCVLYTGMLTNVDSNALTDLSAGTVGQYTYIR